ncbi:hypothetical protein KJ068_26360 [bacterium]|nr:hypothetical protein [bacterium]
MTASRQTTAHSTERWVMPTGWILSVAGAVMLVLGLSDVLNLAFLFVGGLVAIPMGLLLVAAAHLIKRLNIIEKNTRASAQQHASDEPLT